MDNRFHFGLIKSILVILFLHFAIKRYTIAHETAPQNLVTQSINPSLNNGSDISQEDIRAKMRDFLSSLEDEDVAQPASELAMTGADRSQEYTSYQPADAQPDELIPRQAPDPSSQRPDVTETQLWNGVAPFESSTDLYAFVD